MRVVECWIERANLKEASTGGRAESQLHKQEELEREAQEIAEWARPVGKALEFS